MKTRTLIAAAAGAAMVLAPASALAASHQSATSSRHAAAPTTANWQIPLASGSAQYQVQPGQREFQIELHSLTSLHGSSLLVRVNGAAAGSMKVTSNGIAQLTQNSELGQPVPTIAHGSTVTVKTTTGHLIANGRF